MEKQNKKSNAKNIIKNVVIGAALIGGTLGVSRLVNHVQNTKNLKQLVKVNLDKDFFKNAKEGTETISSVSYQTFTLDIKKDKKTTYEFKLVVYAGASKDFSDTLALDETATSAYVQITNLHAALCETTGTDATEKKNKVTKSYVPSYVEETKTTDGYSKVTLDPSCDIAVYDTIAFFA